MNKDQIRHEIQIHRLLSEILDNKYLSVNAFFKGGTCARMLGFLDRFSVDLDFDLSEKADKKKFRKNLYQIFKILDLDIKDESKNALQFFLKYPGIDKSSARNTIKLELLEKIYKANGYKAQFIPAIGRTAICQTIDTMFAHKLIAPIDRYENKGKIAGRDIYDIHYFFSSGHEYNAEVIQERRKTSLLDYFYQLESFIDRKVTRKTIDEDLNVLLDYEKFSKMRKYLKEEVLKFIRAEIKDIK